MPESLGPFEDTSRTSPTPVLSQLNSTTASANPRPHTFPPTTATISSQDFPVFTTDSQPKWRPQSPSNPPAQPVQQPPPSAPLQDFVLYDQPRPSGQPRSISSTSAQLLRSRYNSIQRHRRAARTGIIGSASRSSSGPSQERHHTAVPSPSASPQVPLPARQPGPSRPPVPLFPPRPVSVPQSPVGMDTQVDFEELRGMDHAVSATAYSSPAMHSIFDVNGSASSSMTNVGTVSPQDLLIHEPYISAPNSTALTALTSPSIYNESPDFNDAFNMSPNFENGELDNGSGDPWFPLFPSEVPMGGVAGSDQPPTQDSTNSPTLESATHQKKRKSGGASPGTPSSGSGVGSRRREKALPPIIVEDPSDVVAMKRARNTLAARKSRERKAQRLDELEERISALERERDYWKGLAEDRGAA